MTNSVNTAPTITLSSRTQGGAAALRAYQEATAGVFGARPDGIASPEDFRIDLRATHLGNVLLAECTCSAQRFERSRHMVATTGTDHLYAVLYTEGGSIGLADGREYRVRTGDVSFLDLSRPRETRSDAFSNITLVMPRGLFEAQGTDVEALHGQVLRREQPTAVVLAEHMKALAQHSTTLSLSEADTMGTATVALVASLLERGGGRKTGRKPVSQREAILHYIDAHLGDPQLTPSRLMDVFGIPRATLYRLFDREGGVAGIIRARRLAQAARLLTSPRHQEQRVSAIAHRLGFVDAASFSRAFRAHYGIAPSEARVRPAALWTDMRASSENALLDQWVRGLRQ